MSEDDEQTGRVDPRSVRPAHRPPSAPEMARAGHANRALPISSPQEAALYDAVVVPRYSALFSRPLLDMIPNGTRGQVLDLGCGTGHPALEILRRMADHGRVIAIDRDSGLIDLARRRAVEASGRRIFFKVESMDELSFGDEVFDLAVGNLSFGGRRRGDGQADG